MSQHAEVFSLVEAGLSKACRVPIRTSTNYVAEHNQDRAYLKHLTHCMIARAELAKTEGRTNDMFDAYLEAHRFAHELGRGGLTIDWLQQIGSEALVLRSFSSSISDLSPQQCADALTVIRNTQADREQLNVVIRRTRKWQDATYESSALHRARLAAWKSVLKEALQSRSLDPLDKLPSRFMVKRQEAYQTMVDGVCEQLRRQLDSGRKGVAN
jgi:hypothetical protein